jgi:hypothetical protein
MRKNYQKPAMRAVALQLKSRILIGSPQGMGKPSASFMSNPTIGDNDEE